MQLTKNHRRFTTLALFTLLTFTFTAEAKRFRNAYVSFELPPNWNCQIEGTDWVCTNQFQQRAKEAIIILTAKEVGPTDSLSAYRAHLQTPRTIPGKNGAQTQSKVIHVKDRTIGNHPWIDGMHLGSEIGPYYTRYLATIKDKVAVLVTFSAHKEHFTKYSGDFLSAIESLRAVADKDLVADRGAGSGGSAAAGTGQESIGAPSGQTISLMDTEQLPPEDGTAGKASKTTQWFALLLMAMAVGVYLWIKKRKKS